MQRQRTWAGGLGLLAGLAVMMGAAPATPTYYEVSRRIDEASSILSNGRAAEKAEGWTTFFDAVEQELDAQATAEDAEGRLAHLERLGRMRDVLAGAGWGPSGRIADALNEWLVPRLGVAHALGNLGNAVDALEEGSVEPKEPWSEFVEKLGQAGRDYESASSVTDRLNALRKLRGGLDSLRATQWRRPWAPAVTLERELDQLFDRPNVQIVADVSILEPFLNQDVVKPETIAFKGQVSQVTPGPRTGFGLMPSSDGIAFYNSQYSYSVTPIQGFQQQVEADPQGRQAANLYQFAATSYNTNHITAVAVLTPNGLFVEPQNAPSVSAAFGAAPQPGFGPGLIRGIASLIGLDRQAILERLQQQALPRIQQETVQGTRELAAIKAGQEQARQNALIRQYLVGNRTLRFQDYAITELGFASNPQAAYVSGVAQWAAHGGPQIGADFPKPPELARPAAGATVDVNLNSALTNLAAGFFNSGAASNIENLLVKIIPPEGDAPPTEGLEVSQNASYADLLAAIDDVRARSDDPGAVAIRVSVPESPPSFAVDAQGRLVAFVRDLTLEVPAPENFGGGGGGLLGFGGTTPRTLRFMIQEAEIVLSADFHPERNGHAVAVKGEVASVTYGGSGTTVVLVGDEEDSTESLSLLNRSGALGVLAGTLQGQKVDTVVPIDQLQGFVVAQISDLDPTGWMRVVLQRDYGQAIPVPTTGPTGEPANPNAEQVPVPVADASGATVDGR